MILIFFKMGNHKEEQLAMLEPPDTVKNIKRVLLGVDVDTVKLTRFEEKTEQLSDDIQFNCKDISSLMYFLIIMVEWHLTFFEWTFDLRCLTTTLFSAPLNGHRGHLKGFSPV